MKFQIRILYVVAALFSSTLSAETLGLLMGRQAPVESQAGLSAEIGAVQFGNGSYLGVM